MEGNTKPLSMKLFSTWEGERTAPHCVPRTCTFKLLAVKLSKPFDTEITNLTICASMSVGNFRRSLRTDEIYPDKSGHAELDYCFTFQYPHYLKREENILKLSLQRRKRYRNRTILGFKTVAIGHIDLAQIMQCPTDEKLKLFDKGGGFQVASLNLNQITSIPHESIRNHSGENTSSDDEDIFYPSDDDDSDGEERTKKKPKFKDDLKLKKKFNALLRKMKLNDPDEPLTDEVVPANQYSATFSSIGDISDDSTQSDSDSVGTLPKPQLRPYFTTDFDRDERSERDQSSTDEGAGSNKRHDPVQRLSGEYKHSGGVMNSPLSALRSNARTSGSQSGAPCIGEIRQETLEDEAPSPFRQSPISQESAEDSKTAASSVELSEGHNIVDQLEALFSKGEMQVPESIVVSHCKDNTCTSSFMQSLVSSNACVFLHSGSDAKVFISSLVNRMQKCISRHSRHYPVKITIFGAFSSFTLLLKPLMDSLNNKSSEWIQNFNFIFIPADADNPVCSYVCSVDDVYGRLMDALAVDTDVDLFTSYLRDAKDVMRLTVGRVLVSQLVCESDQDARQFEIPFLHSVIVLFRKKSCVNCLSVDDEVVDKCREHETDIQVDYASHHKRDINSKQVQVKGIFRDLAVIRELGEQTITLKALYREKKTKVALSRLTKKPDILSLNCNVASFTCMIRSAHTSTVRVDGVDYKNVVSLYVSPLWSQNLHFIPLLTTGPGQNAILC